MAFWGVAEREVIERAVALEWADAAQVDERKESPNIRGVLSAGPSQPSRGDASEIKPGFGFSSALLWGAIFGAFGWTRVLRPVGRIPTRDSCSDRSDGTSWKRYLDLTLLSLDEPPTKGTKELEGQRKSQRARETKWALGSRGEKWALPELIILDD
ncbi:uncharacterized protein An04g05830 [Aspergillus niger]|uniref:Contig An04c0180, complete genome n=2 Tax=Aspergillus niger TaxID=5061 RepID=A2QJ52_ASPNC|nr:uncharacterized protein An04g05830 [Aspergillus niger]CAK38846.1 unnamed protein product [Aspergillus niger]